MKRSDFFKVLAAVPFVGAFIPELEVIPNKAEEWEFTDKIILFSRDVCLHWTPTNTGSKLMVGRYPIVHLEWDKEYPTYAGSACRARVVSGYPLLCGDVIADRLYNRFYVTYADDMGMVKIVPFSKDLTIIYRVTEYFVESNCVEEF